MQRADGHSPDGRNRRFGDNSARVNEPIFSGVEMFKPLKILAAAGLLAATAIAANAAPVNVGQAGDGVSNSVVDAQYRGRWDRSCRRDRRGWYRTNRFGERRPCRRWDGRGRRPDACVKFGPVWFCDY